MQVVNRKTKEVTEIKEKGIVKYMYENKSGRILLKILSTRVMANIVRGFMKTFLSIPYKNKIIKKYNINMDLYEDKKYLCYNTFFIRKLKELKFDSEKNSFISPAESKLLVLKLDKDAKLDIKGSSYTLEEILEDDIYKEYENGYALIFRLEETNYHRYIYIDDGRRDVYKHIKGKLHTVQPIAYKRYKIFHENTREWTILHTKNFGDVIHMEVGAMNIGRISNNRNTLFKKGDEKGNFEFGGSTIILFVKDGIINVDEDILENSKNFMETTVNIGERVATKKIN